MEDIAIIGAGGFGREVECLIEMINDDNLTWNFIGYYDDNRSIDSAKVIGNIAELNLITRPLNVVIAIGDPLVISKIVQKLDNPFLKFPNLIAPNVIFYDQKNMMIGKGNIIGHLSIISTNIEIGDFNIFNVKVSVGHDSKIGSFNVIMPNVAISGNVRIGDNNFFGVGSILLQGVCVDSVIRLGAGSILMKNAKKEGLYVGNPAMLLKI